MVATSNAPQVAITPIARAQAVAPDGCRHCELQTMIDAFVRHLRDYRRCSPLTVSAYHSECCRFADYLLRTGHSCQVRDVGRGDLYRFIGSLDHLAPASVRRALYAISSLFNYLCDVEVLDRNPAAGIEPPKLERRLPRVLDAEQCARLLAACETPLEGCVIGLMLFAGLRRQEVIGLDVGDVPVDFAQLRVFGKGSRERCVPINPELREALEAYLAQRTAECPALIVNRVGRRMGVTTISRLFRRLRSRAGLDGTGISPHSLRHAFASHLLRAGVDIATVSALLGHSNVATTSIYCHATDITKTQAVNQLHFSPSSGHATGVEQPSLNETFAAGGGQDE